MEVASTSPQPTNRATANNATSILNLSIRISLSLQPLRLSDGLEPTCGLDGFHLIGLSAQW